MDKLWDVALLSESNTAVNAKLRRCMGQRKGLLRVM